MMVAQLLLTVSITIHVREEFALEMPLELHVFLEAVFTELIVMFWLE